MKTQDWMRLSREVRDELITKYGLIKTGSTDVRGGVVFSDGYTESDLSKVDLLEVNQNVNGKNPQQDGSGVSEGDGSESKKKVNKRKTVSVPTK